MEFFENDDNSVYEFSSCRSDEHSASLSISDDDEQPYRHSGGFLLAISGISGGDAPRVTVKVRESDD